VPPPTTSAPTPVPTAGRGRRPLGAGRIGTDLVAKTRPLSATRDQVLPVPPSLSALFHGGLRRGTVVLVEPATTGGATTLALALLAGASGAGSWTAVVGLAAPGVVAIAELGVDLDRLVLVPRPGAMWPEATATFLAGTDMVLLVPPGPARREVARRLAARAREQRSVLVVLTEGGRWEEGPDVRLRVEASAWDGAEAGHGHLRGRWATVSATGRRGAARPTRTGLWLPGPTGTARAGGGGAEERCSEAVAGGVVPRAAGRGGDR
jgi:hypothetical protein